MKLIFPRNEQCHTLKNLQKSVCAVITFPLNCLGVWIVHDTVFIAYATKSSQKCHITSHVVFRSSVAAIHTT